VNISTHFDGCLDRKQHRLSQKDLLNNSDKPHNIILVERDVFSRLAGPHLEKSIDDIVDVDLNLVVHKVIIIFWGAKNIY